MAFKLQVVCILLVASAGLISAKATGPWSMRAAAAACSESDDIVSCTKDQFLSFIDNMFQRDSFKIFNDIEVTRNGAADNMVSARSNDLAGKLENFIESRNIKFQIPASDASITYTPAVQGNEMHFKVNFGATGRAVEARKSKLKKIFIPIMVFVLLKAMTLIPLALGVLGLKAWNALQLSFFSFITATGLAIFQLCKKIAADHQHPHIAAHGPWEAARSIPEAQNLAYNAFA